MSSSQLAFLPHGAKVLPISTSDVISHPHVPSHRHILRCDVRPEPSPQSSQNDDWRSFRARLVRNEAITTSPAQPSLHPPTDNLEPETPASDIWAHPVSFIEAGSLLLASPQHFRGPHACTFFANTGILILDHSSNGSVGVVINRPISIQLKTGADPEARAEPSAPSPFSSTTTPTHPEAPPPPSSTPSAPHLTTNHNLSFLNDAPVYLGGPVGLESLCVLHGDPEFGNSIAGAVRSASFDDAVEHYRKGELRHGRFFLGYTGWRPGQLEQEIKEGIWYICACCDDLVLRQWPSGTHLHRTVLPLMGGPFSEFEDLLPNDDE